MEKRGGVPHARKLHEPGMRPALGHLPGDLRREKVALSPPKQQGGALDLIVQRPEVGVWGRAGSCKKGSLKGR